VHQQSAVSVDIDNYTQSLHDLWQLFSVLCSDDTLWKNKLQSDFNFSGEATARTSGWKFIYRGLSKPRGLLLLFAINNILNILNIHAII